MASRLSRGRAGGCWFGMQPAPTPLPPRTLQVPPMRQEPWQRWQREKEDQVRPPQFLTYIHPSSHRDIGSHWAAVDDFCEGSRSPPGPSYRGREVHHLPPPEPLCGSPTRECSLNMRNHWIVTP